MTKLDKLKQAEHLYVYDNQPLDVIGAKLDLSRRTLFYWKKEYEWDKKRFEKGREQELFNRELLNFAQKIMNKISTDIDNNQQTPQAEMYSLMNILKNLPQVKQHTDSLQHEQKQNSKNFLSPEHVRQIEREILGME
ncbi:hypothetical protein IJ579_04540 [bacterium]|nr:hypothetical protein [bacterium]